MPTAAKATKTFSLDREILAEIKRTKGTQSESERVNHLLKRALAVEKRAALEREVASFFAAGPDDRATRRAFQAATITVLSRE